MHIVNSLNHAINGQDGRFSSGAFGLVLTSFCVVFIIVNTSQHPGEIETKSWTVEGMVIPLGVLSTIGLWVSVLRRNRRQLRNDSDRHLTHRIKIVFLWIFGLMCIIMACYDVADNTNNPEH
uniref:Transmembrane protein n=1 Tax=Magallana gigas TaxID=29159 RepID=A0A8W8IM34_MAGGI